jgi:hypothetical protein
MNELRSVLALGMILLAGACSSCSSSAPGSATTSAGAGGVDGAAAQEAGGVSGATGDGGKSGGDDATAAGSGKGVDAASASDTAPQDATTDGPAADSRPGSGEAGGVPPGTWPPVGDYGAHGPLATVRDTNTGPGGAYDIFRPMALGPSPRKNPIVSWANGTLFGVSSYQMLLDHWASHGFVVIAAHSQSTAGGATHKAGIDWLVAESGRSASIYFGLLDTSAIGAAGHSQGGGATIAAGANAPGPTGIVATLPLMPILSFETDMTIVMRQTAPMFNINATMDNRDPTGAFANAIYAGSNRELVQAAFIGIHEDAMSAAMLAPTLAWFRLHLMGDDSAKAMFYPDKTCGLCQNPAWKQVRYKNTP